MAVKAFITLPGQKRTVTCQTFKSGKRLIDTQILQVASLRLQQLVRRFPWPPALRRRVAEEAQGRLAERRREVHRSAVNAYDAIAQRQRRDQPGQRLGGARQQGKSFAALCNGARLVVIARMLRIVGLAGSPEQQKSRRVPLGD